MPPEGKEAITATLRRILADYLEAPADVEKIVPDIPLLEQGIDSFDFMRLLVDIEDVFTLELSGDDLLTRRMDTLEDLVELIASFPAREELL